MVNGRILIWSTGGEWYWQVKTTVLWERPIPVPLCPLHPIHTLPWNWTQASVVSCQWQAAYLHCTVQQKCLSAPHSQIRCQYSSWLANDKKYDSSDTLVSVVKLTASIFCTMSWKAGCVRNGSNTCFLYRSVYIRLGLCASWWLRHEFMISNTMCSTSSNTPRSCTWNHTQLCSTNTVPYVTYLALHLLSLYQL